ncbi:MAG: hypothetical protein B7Y07_07305 [Halothiobacillus sp. 24-54-40]|jgi:alkylhydroperoxidase family enzyme|nr:MAG: hypothetical protein B7X12_00520 [Halothiobacillus sp. 20-53-49]OYY39589.1 MAG: hypothetical protein B7Y58_05140 [Halothiobacillus sp. 35-54-62]OYZ86645.1 MAG: hypothetical protein B7Y07_07305 [Halothiobacillus sp. 24-54-40]OZA81101.1 MAG: hypothetical protein B7X64_02935 [Halothiobacillus sp. 39-53-45]HQS03478.1 hypothetical protein [Halothiobacillus sp.]
MSLIKIIPPEHAQGLLAETYQEIQHTFGSIPNAMQLGSASPHLLSARWQATRYFREHPTLSMALQATIRMLVSAENDCDYCVDFNASMLINYCGQTLEQVTATRQDPSQTPLPAKDKSLLSFVLKALHTAAAVSADDIAECHALGWTDGDMLDAVTLAANNRAVDMILNTFKVERDF